MADTLAKILTDPLTDSLKVLTTIADKYFDGHYTIFKFTNHYKVMFGTPGLDVSDRERIKEIVPAETIEHAIVNTVFNFNKKNVTDPSYMKGK